jgi:hypothetical protein
MRSAILLLLVRGLLVSSLAVAQSAQPPARSSAIATPVISSRSRIGTERSAGLTPYSSEKVDRKNYRSSIAQGASPSPSFEAHLRATRGGAVIEPSLLDAGTARRCASVSSRNQLPWSIE